MPIKPAPGTPAVPTAAKVLIITMVASSGTDKLIPIISEAKITATPKRKAVPFKLKARPSGKVRRDTLLLIPLFSAHLSEIGSVPILLLVTNAVSMASLISL